MATHRTLSLQIYLWLLSSGGFCGLGALCEKNQEETVSVNDQVINLSVTDRLLFLRQSLYRRIDTNS
jgi:hypothetical protein